MDIDRMIKLNGEQQALAKEMQALYLRMQEANMAFALNENGTVVVYNCEHIEDCADCAPLFSPPECYEYADMEQMEELFPVWVSDELYVKPKEAFTQRSCPRV